MKGDVLGQRYELIKLLGKGGMGCVWEARDKHLHDALVAVKVPHAEFAVDPTLRKRFEQEAVAVARLQSPHVVRITDYRADEHELFLVMEYLNGESLLQKLRRQERLPPPVVAEVVLQIALALTAAHSAGVIHRDLKPANVFLVDNSERPFVKVLDFGIAKVIGSRAGDCPSTGRDEWLGTPLYMSPEQLRREPASPAMDNWALAVIAVECLYGRYPFDLAWRGIPARIAALCEGPMRRPPELHNVPAAIETWASRALDARKKRRLFSALTLASSLQDAVATTTEKHERRAKTFVSEHVGAYAVPRRALLSFGSKGRDVAANLAAASSAAIVSALLPFLITYLSTAFQ